MTEPIPWNEDEFYGRYVITLRIDTGTVDEMLAIVRRLREVAPGLGLGYELESTNVVGFFRERAAGNQ